MFQKARIGIGLILLVLAGCASAKTMREEDDRAVGVSYQFGAGKLPDGY